MARLFACYSFSKLILLLTLDYHTQLTQPLPHSHLYLLFLQLLTYFLSFLHIYVTSTFFAEIPCLFFAHCTLHTNLTTKCPSRHVSRDVFPATTFSSTENNVFHLRCKEKSAFLPTDFSPHVFKSNPQCKTGYNETHCATPTGTFPVSCP